MNIVGRFVEETHTYYLTTGGVERQIVSVTQVLRDLIPGWSGSEYDMGKGRAVHAAAAMIARGVDFDFDPQISGKVAACRRFFAEVRPVVIDVEQQVYSVRLQYAGTYDAILEIGGKCAVVDWKSSIEEGVVWQVSAYSLAREEMGNGRLDLGFAVKLGDDGTYKMSDPYNLKIAKREWPSLLTTYNIRQRCGKTEKCSTPAWR